MEHRSSDLRYLQHEVSVPALMQQRARRRPSDRQATKDKGPGGESDDLLLAFPVLPNHLNGFDFAPPSLRHNESREVLPKQCARARYT